MKNLALKRIQKMTAYQPPLDGRRQFSGLLLDFNERTSKTSKSIQKELSKLVADAKLNIYPEYPLIAKKVAAYAKVKEQEVLITNGSDHALELVFRTFADSGDRVVIPEPTFPILSQAARICGNKIISPEYQKPDLTYPLDKVLKLANQKPRIIVICNPNNPTGTLLPLKDIETIAKQARDSIVLVDEAYYEFSGVTAAGLIKKYPNIVVTRTFSKAFGIPAVRLGYIVANKKYISELSKVRSPYDVNMFAYTAALAALNEVKSSRQYVRQVMKKSKPLLEKFFTDNSIPYFNSASNFILFRPADAQKAAKVFLKNGIRVRPQYKAAILGTLRVSIGTLAETREFVRVYKEKILKFEKKKVSFIDRDATLIFEPQDTFQIDSLKKLKVLNGAIAGLQELKKAGYRLVMVSNQDGLGTKSFPKKNFLAPHNKMLKIFESAGVKFDEILICPHFQKDNCSCRKPKTGLLEDYLRKVEIDPEKSFVCGDRQSDKLLAKNLNLSFAPIKTNGNFLKAVKPFIK